MDVFGELLDQYYTLFLSVNKLHVVGLACNTVDVFSARINFLGKVEVYTFNLVWR